MKTASAKNSPSLQAGAAVVDVTPNTSVFLYGYPHVPRYSTGVHDPLECAALFLRSGTDCALFMSTDIATVDKDLAAEVRRGITAATGVPGTSILVASTHTHSGPVTGKGLSGASDTVVPAEDEVYIKWLAGKMIEAGCAAVRAAAPAEVGLAVTRAEGVGSNRHHPSGPADPEVPVLVARSLKDGQPIGCAIVYSMHPTVLHEDSKLISGDFIHFTRQWVKAKALTPSCPIVYINGTAGNQSPRHMTKANTFAEAQRLGEKLGQSIAGVIPAISYHRELPINVRTRLVDMKVRSFPSQAEADEGERLAKARFQHLKQSGAPRQDVRTAECDMFGAEETAELVRAVNDGRLAAVLPGSTPAEIQVIQVGKWKFVAWPGEFYVEYGLAVKAKSPDTYVINYANGSLQGYIVTPDAVAKKMYEATNAIFSHENGPRFVEASLELLKSGG